MLNEYKIHVDKNKVDVQYNAIETISKGNNYICYNKASAYKIQINYNPHSGHNNLL